MSLVGDGYVENAVTQCRKLVPGHDFRHDCRPAMGKHVSPYFSFLALRAGAVDSTGPSDPVVGGHSLDFGGGLAEPRA